MPVKGVHTEHDVLLDVERDENQYGELDDKNGYEADDDTGSECGGVMPNDMLGDLRLARCWDIPSEPSESDDHDDQGNQGNSAHEYPVYSPTSPASSSPGSDVCAACGGTSSADDSSHSSGASAGSPEATTAFQQGPWTYVPVAGGHIVYKPGSREINAHCKDRNHGKKCHCDRTGKRGKGRRQTSGRPLGFLLLWLDYVGDPEAYTGEDHRQLKAVLGSRDFWHERRQLRTRFKANPDSYGAFEEERSQGSDWDSEPSEVPYQN